MLEDDESTSFTQMMLIALSAANGPLHEDVRLHPGEEQQVRLKVLLSMDLATKEKGTESSNTDSAACARSLRAPRRRLLSENGVDESLQRVCC